MSPIKKTCGKTFEDLMTNIKFEIKVTLFSLDFTFRTLVKPFLHSDFSDFIVSLEAI